MASTDVLYAFSMEPSPNIKCGLLRVQNVDTGVTGDGFFLFTAS